MAITPSTTVTSWFCRLYARPRPFLLAPLLLCGALGFLYHVATTNNYLIWHERLISNFPGVGQIGYSNESNFELHRATTIKPYAGTDQVLLVDNRTKSMRDLIIEATASIGNIPPSPYILGEDQGGPQYLHNSSCARFPTVYDLEFSNIYWQTLRTFNGPVYLYAAYFDIRTLSPLGPSLRITAMMDRKEPNVTTYCQIWFEREMEPVISKVVEYTIIWNRKWDNSREGSYHPYLLACQVPYNNENGKVPASVSLVEKPCDAANNNLRVIFNKPAKKKGFGVCVKALDFIEEDISARLVEWIELLGILGADKIFIYEFALHPNATKVLRYYHEIGRIVFTPFTLPGSDPNDPRIRHMFLGDPKNINEMCLYELLPYNDCLYRNLYNYEYLAVTDIDEVIIPTKDGGWNELMLEVDPKSGLTNKNKNDSMASYCFRQLHIVDDVSQGHEQFPGIPKYLYMLQNVYRSPKIEVYGDGAKCFHNPQRVLTVHNHFPLECLDNSCSNYDVKPDLALMQHYRKDCLLGKNQCTKEFRESTQLETRIWRYKKELIDRCTKVLGTLGFIPSVAANPTTTN